MIVPGTLEVFLGSFVWIPNDSCLGGIIDKFTALTAAALK